LSVGLDTPVDQAWRGRGDPPGGVGPDGFGAGQEVQRAACRQLVLPPHSGLEQVTAALPEFPVQQGHQIEGLGGKDFVVPAAGRAGHLNAT